MQNGSKPFSWNALDWQSLGWGALDVTVAALLTYATDTISAYDFGDATPAVFAVFALGAKTVRRWMKNNAQ